MKRAIRLTVFYTAIIAIWVIVAKLRLWPPYLFPPPWSVWEALKAGFQDHSFWIGIAVTMKRMFIGYSLSVILGMILGLSLSTNNRRDDLDHCTRLLGRRFGLPHCGASPSGALGFGTELLKFQLRCCAGLVFYIDD
jgi:hypothetical protein